MEGDCRTRNQAQQSLENILQDPEQKDLSEALAGRETEYTLCRVCDLWRMWANISQEEQRPNRKLSPIPF